MSVGEQTLRRPVRDARRGRGWYSAVARAGLVAKGISFAIVGALAAKLAVGDGGKATSREGALATIADEAVGKALLVALAAGFAAYALWRVVQAVAEREPDDDEPKGFVKKWGKRAGYVGRAAIYGGLTYTTTRLVFDAGGARSQNEHARRTAAEAFAWPGGRWLVLAAGLGILGVGLWNAYRGVTRTFEDRWRVGRMTPAGRRWGCRAGIAGHLSRGVVFGLIGVFLAKAALEVDSRDAIGLDGALQKLAASPYGPFLLGLTAAGLVAYGVYCLADARLRDVSVDAG